MKKRFSIGIVGAGILILASWLAFAPVRAAQAAPLAPGIAIQVMPTALRPATGGMVTVSGGYPLDVTVTLHGEPLDVYWTGESYLAVFSVGFDAQPGSYQINVTAEDPATGTRLIKTETVTVEDFDYPREAISLPYRLIPLLQTDLNESEQEQLDAIYALRTQPSQWSWPFGLPVVQGAITSRFGGDRTYNGGMWYQYHTGVDFRGEVGDPILATAGGRVVAARFFEVRGNVIIIDHGYGVFSQYAHLTEILVEPGQVVRRGQLLALAGATGRTNGPHLHFEVIVNGQAVDPIRWLALSPAFVAPPEVPARQPAEPVAPDDSSDGDALPPDEGGG